MIRLARRHTLAAVAAATLLLAGCGQVDTGPPSPQEVESPAPGSTDSGPGDLLDTGHGATPGSSTSEDRSNGGSDRTTSERGLPGCDVLDLPATARDTIEDIEAGGPYEFPRNDGVRFQNREQVLPQESREYYREFTVITPQLDHRGARRIVTGGGSDIDPDHWYYTGDHYESFCEFDPDDVNNLAKG